VVGACGGEKKRNGRCVEFLKWEPSPAGGTPHKRFYEKVIKVKADVAALLYLFLSDVGMNVGW
jgi:hypothetical protein